MWVTVKDSSPSDSSSSTAVTVTGAIPQLGFIHEHSGEAFALDIADLFRDTILLVLVWEI